MNSIKISLMNARKHWMDYILTISQIGILLFLARTFYQQKQSNQRQYDYNQEQMKYLYAQISPKIDLDFKKIIGIDNGKINFEFEVGNYGSTSANIWFNMFSIDTTIASPYPSANLPMSPADTIKYAKDEWDVVGRMLNRSRSYLCPSSTEKLHSGYISIKGINNNDSLFTALSNQRHYLHVVSIYSDLADSSFLLTYTYGLEITKKRWIKWSFINSSKETIKANNTTEPNRTSPLGSSS